MENDLDQQTLDLMIELQLQDARNMIKGKHRHGGEARDCEVAAKIFEKELQNLASFYVDRAMSRSIAHAVVADEVAIAAHLSEEQQASNDRAFALRGQPQTKVPTPSKASPDTAIEDEMMQRLIALYIGDSRPPSAAGPSSARAGPSSASRTTTDVRRCAACISDFPFYETARCPCSHDYCRDCITELFSAAINDESLYPPRCCKKPIPLGLNRIFLPAELLGLYKAKELEYSTPNRTYCHVPSCSTFVPPAFVHGDVATCVKCESTTCTICKGKTHTGDCPADMSTLDILRIAAKNGWQRCYSCRRVVDLTMGCNHITCRCGAEFCYVCGLKWKRCNCELWEEARLTGRVNNIVDRDAGGRDARGAARDAIFERERQNLVQNHQCVDHSWRSRQGEHQCEECLDWLPEFIYECRHCRIMACRRCRLNRL